MRLFKMSRYTAMVAILFFLSVITFQCKGSIHSELDDDWLKFKNAFNKQYTSDYEDNMRRNIFEKNINLIASHNRDYDLGLTTYTLGLNEFADWTNFEINEYLTGLKIDNHEERSNDTFQQTVEVESLPRVVDWRTKNVLTPVKNQGQCGSCWAFSATGAIEGQHAIKKKQLVSLSEQNLIDCTLQLGNLGCKGGFPVISFQYVIKNGGIDTENTYYYEGKDGTCRFNPANIGATISKYRKVKRGSEAALQQAVAQIGPISVLIHVSSKFKLYKQGIYDEPECDKSVLNHAVLAVGYADSYGNDYWIVKNSWGTTWGQKGYVYMSRNRQNQCGIASSASYPLI